MGKRDLCREETHPLPCSLCSGARRENVMTLVTNLIHLQIDEMPSLVPHSRAAVEARAKCKVCWWCEWGTKVAKVQRLTRANRRSWSSTLGRWRPGGPHPLSGDTAPNKNHPLGLLSRRRFRELCEICRCYSVGRLPWWGEAVGYCGRRN